MARLQGKRAVILGASSPDNMGQHIARRFMKEGASVLVSGRKEDVLKQFAEETGCEWVPCDLTDEASVNALADAAQAKLGGIDIAVNATGWGLLKPFLDTTHEDLVAMTDLQYIGPFHFCQAMLRKMMRSNGGGGGSIIQISSATATIMLNDHAAYMGTKAGTDHVIRCVAHEFGSEGVRANSISPGLTDTPMTAHAKEVPGVFDAFLAGYPLGRIGTSDDIAAAAVWLASDECFMTGENLQVNGGLTLRRNPMNSEIEAAVVAAAQAAK
ncbi:MULTISPECIES: SDR family NAD(P)-dependent oxidoreductase [Novosphingobium]|uniref:NAD(P)-dependent dehydrogenase, short-chain alcohol dehydrogenase family n=1 Tax=Novosphingobium mathurense TaxID=428990 RepID=A0A1U6ISJ6_9SPHN|nr:MULTISPECIES: SDR family oxidoreductase [Novosphingobium]GFM30591.1 short-chain dehydrogenase/reductase SDR [Novosphingobium sp. PY1]SLK10993.1 NAD(P)-dependent dehydrogenase, short-chain alcohol dehydrogenase family [Novosphingobium mathurense]